MEVKEALQKIVDNQKEPSLNWAVEYAIYGLQVSDAYELKVQCLYVLNNMSRWRGEEAKEVRETLKKFAKGGRK